MHENSRRVLKRLFPLGALIALLIGVGVAHFLTTATVDLDANRGLVRTQSFFAGYLVNESIEETPVSVVLQSDTDLEPLWRRVEDSEGFWLGTRAMNSGESQNVRAVREIGELWTEGKFTSGAQRESALALLGCARENPLRALSYMKRLRTLSKERQGENSQPIDVEDLPEIPTEP